VTDLIVVPRWGGTEASDFYPWLVARAARELALSTTVVALQPTPGAPEPLATTAAIARAIADARDPVVLAHSVGCRAALCAVAGLAADRPLAALLCVAGWFTIDAPWPTIVPWLADDLVPGPRVAARVRRLEVVISDDDPFTADHATTRARFEQLGARVHVEPGARHFNRAEEPAVWQLLEQLVRGRA
jgi:uncharacterized protein